MPVNTATSRRVFLGARTMPGDVGSETKRTPTNDLLMALFGTGTYEDRNIQGWAEQNVSTMSMPHSLQNKNVPVLSQVIEQKAILADRFPTQVLAPIRVVDAATDAVQWEEITFNAAIPQVVPERGRTRVARMSSDQHSDTMRRFGLGLEYNYGFFLYPQGLTYLRIGVEQVNNGVLDVMAVGVIRALVEQDYNKKIDREYLKRNMKHELMEKVLERERFFFGALQRLDKPIQAIDKFIVNRQQEYGGQGNTWVMHWRMQEWLDLGVPRYNEYTKGGDEANDYLLDRTDSFLQFGNGQRVYIMRTLNVDNRGEFDILKEIAIYGEWVLAFDHTRTLLPSNQYESKWRSIQIYDANEDEWAVLTLEQLIRNSGRWNMRTGKLNPAPASMRGTDSFHVRDSSGNLKPIETFGQISTEFFPASAIDNVASSVVRSVAKSAGAMSGAMTVDQAAAVIHNYAQLALDVEWDTDLTTYLDALITANGGKGRAPADKFNGVPSVLLTNNSLDLAGVTLAAKHSVPPLLIHYAAMRAFAASQLGDATYRSTVKGALDTLDNFVAQARAVTTLMGDSADSTFPTYLPAQNKAMEMFVKNIQGRDYLPGWLRMEAAPANVTAPSTSTVITQVVQLAAQARNQVETTLTGKFDTVAATGGATATNLIAAAIGSGATGTSILRLVSPVASQPTWGKANTKVTSPQQDLDTANMTPLGQWVLVATHNISTTGAVTDANVDLAISTQAAKALILTAIGTVDQTTITTSLTAIKTAVDAVKSITNSGTTSYSDSALTDLFEGLKAIAGLNPRTKDLMTTVMRNYNTAKTDQRQIIRDRAQNASGAAAAAAATSGYLRSPLMISPNLFGSMVAALAGSAATATPQVMPADPMNPAQIMPNLVYYATETNRPSILLSGESSSITAAVQANRERVLNSGNSQDRVMENTLKASENTISEVVKTIRDPLKLGVAMQYLSAAPTLQNVLNMEKQNIVVPFSFMIQRPAISWFTYGGLKVLAGEQTAVTWFKSPVWSWQDDGTLQVYRAVLTYYSKTTVLQPKNVYLARHMLLDEYLGGMGVDFYEGGTGARHGFGIAAMGNKRDKHRPSILISMEPYNMTPKNYDKLISTRGEYVGVNSYVPKNKNFHYINQAWVMAHYNLSTASQTGAQDEESAVSKPNNDALLMWRGMARYPLPSAGGVLEYRAVSMPQGYFPDTIYGPGMRRTWDDPFTPYRHYDYHGSGYVGLAV